MLAADSPAADRVTDGYRYSMAAMMPPLPLTTTGTYFTGSVPGSAVTDFQ